MDIALSNDPAPIRLSPGAAVTQACLWEAAAPKPGNVHPGASFTDASYGDYVASAVVVGPIVERAADAGVGQTVLDAVRATRDAVGTNTNLGTLLLVVPLAAVPNDVSLHHGIADVLASLTTDDTALVYEAIRLAAPGGLQPASTADVSEPPPAELDLTSAMRLAADRDLVARQYTNGFADVLGGTAEWIAEGVAEGWAMSAAIVHAHIRQLASEPDTLIAGKCGADVAREASRRAASVLAAGAPGSPGYDATLADLDRWLRADGHRRNPGTSADLIAAGLFALLREGVLRWPIEM